jgi:hypothetical protein
MALLLCAAVLLLPFPIASAWSGGAYPELGSLQEAVSSGLVRFWSVGGTQVGAPLGRTAEFWARFHIVKAALAAILLIVLVLLAARVWRASAYAVGRSRRWTLTLVGLVTTPLTVLALVVLVANLQGAIAPLSSVLGVLPLAAPKGQLASTLGQIRQSLAAGGQSPATDALLHDFVVYHVAMVALGGAVTVALLVISFLMVRMRRRVPAADQRWRRLLMAASASLVMLSAVFAIAAAASLSTAANPTPALLGFFAGGL